MNAWIEGLSKIHDEYQNRKFQLNQKYCKKQIHDLEVEEKEKVSIFCENYWKILSGEKNNVKDQL